LRGRRTTLAPRAWAGLMRIKFASWVLGISVVRQGPKRLRRTRGSLSATVEMTAGLPQGFGPKHRVLRGVERGWKRYLVPRPTLQLVQFAIPGGAVASRAVRNQQLRDQAGIGPKDKPAHLGRYVNQLF
jgi:hypothetical protein